MKLLKSFTIETLKSLKTHSLSQAVPAGASALVWDQKQLIARFAALQDAGFSRKHRPRAAAYILLFGLFVLSYFVIVQPARYPSDNEFWDSSGGFDEDVLLPYRSEMSGEYIVHVNDEFLFYIDGCFMGYINENQLSEDFFKSIPILEENK